MTATLKLGQSETVLPGLALPEAFLSLDNRLDSTLQLCRLSGQTDGPLLGVVAICQELQNLLKYAFIENGLLASRIEILTRYQMESVKRTDKKVTQIEVGHKATKKHVKKLRKRLSVYETLQRRKDQKWWDVKVRSTDYDTFSTLSRGSGCPDLAFMLRVNQVLIDFVNDSEKEELVLPPMGLEERAELSKLASIYKLRCRYGKSTQLASSTLIKARQTTIPNPGEVDSVLNSFARTHKHTAAEDTIESGSQEVPVKDTTSSQPAPSSKLKPSSPSIDIPSTMLTPLSSLTSPTIDMGSSSLSLGQSPPTSGLSTPTAESAPKRFASTPSESNTNDPKKPIDAGTHDKQPPLQKGKVEPPKPIQLKDPRLSHVTTPTSNIHSPPPTALTLQQQLCAQLQQHGRALNLTGAQVASGALAGKSFLGGTGGILFQGQLRSLGNPAVVASPVKVAQMAGNEGRKGGEGDKRDKDVGASSAKRIRITRKSAGVNLAED